MSEGIKNPNRLSDRRLQRELRRLESKQKSEEGVMEQKFQETLRKLGILHVILSFPNEQWTSEAAEIIQTYFREMDPKKENLITSDAEEAIFFKQSAGNCAAVCLVTVIAPADKNSLPNGHEDDLQG